jgi:hypothetical protein
MGATNRGRAFKLILGLDKQSAAFDGVQNPALNRERAPFVLRFDPSREISQ